MMMLELSSYVGDVLSYYTDVQLRESILEQAQEKKTYSQYQQPYGYKTKVKCTDNNSFHVPISTKR